MINNEIVEGKDKTEAYELEYTLTNDVLFKMLFRDHPALLKCLVAELLGIQLESIGHFTIKNPEIPPDAIGNKFCRLDIVMEVDNRLIDLEVQVADEKNYRERSLYNWARLFSSGLPSGDDYSALPTSIVISILAFSLFDCVEFHSEFCALEVTRHELLTDKMGLHFFELPKLPEVVDGSNGLKLWLAFFKAKTKEDLITLQNIGGTIMTQAVQAYHSISASGEFKELERLRARARFDEANALAGARKEGRLEGKLEGKREGKLEGKREGALNIARNLKAEGMDTDTVARITGLTIDEVLQL